jgi:hypothetical protein
MDSLSLLSPLKHTGCKCPSPPAAELPAAKLGSCTVKDAKDWMTQAAAASTAFDANFT